MLRNLCLICCLLLAVVSVRGADPPNYGCCRLDSIFPAGAQVGQTVVCEFTGNNGGMQGAKDIVIDGPPGITVTEVKTDSNGIKVFATLAIASDAVPGRRRLRVVNERSGLTCFGWFAVGRLPEVVEQEPNHELPQEVSIPVVANGRVNPAADVDAYIFTAKGGQKLVAAIASHAFDAHGQYKNYGYADASLQITDEKGKVLAEADDTIGLDPLIEFVAPDDGKYIARVQLSGYRGFPEAIYRLTLGEVPVVTSVFPPGGRRGTTVDVEFFGPNVPPGTRKKIEIPATGPLPVEYIFPDVITAGDHDVPFAISELPEIVEVEQNGTPETATAITMPALINARFNEPGDVDWYKLTLKAGQKVWLDVQAHRHLRSPADSLLQIYDSEGKLVGENDDDLTPMDYMSIHDYKTTDSRLMFTVPRDGEYKVKLVEQSGVGGERSVYRFSVSEALPDFNLLLFPDAVPVWGPGSTAALLVRIDRLAGFNEAVDLTIEGLPAGWTGSTSTSTPVVSTSNYGKRVWLTVTSPADAKPGDIAPFVVKGVATLNGQKVERFAQPITLYYSSDTGFFRVSPQARAAVTLPHGPRLEALANELTLTQGEYGKLSVRLHGYNEPMQTTLVNLSTNGVSSTLGTPEALSVNNGVVEVKVSTENLHPGTHCIVVSGRWGADIRGGMPGPCSQIVRLHVKAK